MPTRRVAILGNLANVGYLYARALRDEGCEVDLYVTSKDTEMPAGQNPYLRYNIEQQDWISVFTTRPMLKSIMRGRKLFKKYDLVIAITLSPAYAQFFGVPFVAIATGSDLREFVFQRGVYNFLLRRAYRKARHVFYVVAGLKDSAAKLGLEKKSSFIPLPANDPPTEIYEENVVRTGELKLFWPSAWFPIKGTDRFVDACRKLFDEGTQFHITVVDHAKDDALDEKSREHVQRFLSDYKEHITLVPPIRDQKELMRAYRAADLTVDQFILGDVGFIDVESMMLERPVLDYFNPDYAATYNGQPSPVIQASTKEEITSALRALVNDPGARERLTAQGKQAHLWAEQFHSMRAVAHKLMMQINAR